MTRLGRYSVKFKRHLKTSHRVVNDCFGDFGRADSVSGSVAVSACWRMAVHNLLRGQRSNHPMWLVVQ